MAPRTSYGNLPFGPNPLVLFDQSFADTDNRTIVPCACTGTNTLILTPVAASFPPSFSVATFYGILVFVAVNMATGPLTANVASTSALNIYRTATVQAGAGDIQAAEFYGLWPNASLNGGSGGYYLLDLGVGTGAGARNQRSATSSPINAVATDQIINVNINSGSPILNLPPYAAREGIPITVVDVGGHFGTHNLSVTPNGAETINGVNAPFPLTGDFQSITFNPFNDGVNTGWFIT